MGYLDALTSGYFKTTPDGRKLFFPWGWMGKGYVIASEQDYQRLRRQYNSYTIVGLILILGIGILIGYLWVLVATALLVPFYIGWTRYLLRGLQPSNEKLSLNESVTSQARALSVAYSVWLLWPLTVCALIFVIMGIAILIVDPRDWLTKVAAIVVAGLCAAFFLRMLILRRRTDRDGR